MPLKPQFSARLTIFPVAALAVAVFAFGRPVSASGQTPAPQVPATAPPATPGPEVQITSDDAVRMALENNLGIQASRLSPEVQALALTQTRAAFAPTVFTNATKDSRSTPLSNFLGGSNAFVTNEGLRTNVGVLQQLPWGGGDYQISMDGSRNTTSDPSDPFNPRLTSNLNFTFTQPLLRDFAIDNVRQQLLLGEKQQEIVDVQLQQQVTQTSRRVRSAYFDLIGAIGQLGVARQTLELSQQSLKDNETRVEVGTLPPIDIIEAQAEVSRNEENVIIAEARIKTLEDILRTLIMNPSQPDFWTTHITPAEEPVVTPQPIDVEGAVANALANRTDLAQARKELEQTDIGIKFARNQRLPAVNAVVNYGLAGVGGTRLEFDNTSGVFPPPVTNQTQRSFNDALRDIFGNEFRTWSFQLQVNYPIGTSAAEAALAQGRLQRQQGTTTLRQLEMQVATSVRDAGRQVETSLKRVEATTKAREFAERRLEAEQKRTTVGLSTTFQLFQAQRELSQQRLSELTATIDYNRALVNFQAVQSVPIQ
ncbi:MAG: TolC family protein [Vicinamibacterales bacterium]